MVASHLERGNWAWLGIARRTGHPECAVERNFDGDAAAEHGTCASACLSTSSLSSEPSIQAVDRIQHSHATRILKTVAKRPVGTCAARSSRNVILGFLRRNSSISQNSAAQLRSGGESDGLLSGRTDFQRLPASGAMLALRGLLREESALRLQAAYRRHLARQRVQQRRLSSASPTQATTGDPARTAGIDASAGSGHGNTPAAPPVVHATPVAVKRIPRPHSARSLRERPPWNSSLGSQSFNTQQPPRRQPEPPAWENPARLPTRPLSARTPQPVHTEKAGDQPPFWLTDAIALFKNEGTLELDGTLHDWDPELLHALTVHLFRDDERDLSTSVPSPTFPTRRRGGRKLALRALGLEQVPPPLLGLNGLAAFERVDLSNNRFTHSLWTSGPTTPAGYPRLKELNLSWNRLECIPSEVLTMSALQKLDVSHNRIAEIPRGLEKLCSISYLDLSHNALADEALPSTIAKLTGLAHLNVSHNRLKRIPWLLLGLKNMSPQHLVLHDNVTPAEEMLLRARLASHPVLVVEHCTAPRPSFSLRGRRERCGVGMYQGAEGEKCSAQRRPSGHVIRGREQVL